MMDEQVYKRKKRRLKRKVPTVGKGKLRFGIAIALSCIVVLLVLQSTGVLKIFPGIEYGGHNTDPSGNTTSAADGNINGGGSTSITSTADIETNTDINTILPEERIENLLINLTDPSGFIGKSIYPDDSSEKAYNDGSKIRYWVFKNDTAVEHYKPDYNLAFGSSDSYTNLEGVTTFRGNHYRDAPSFGSADIKEKKLHIEWTYDIGVIDTWPGVGWTGQPLLVHWPEDVRMMMNIDESLKAKDLVEVIYPTLDGNIYFLDLETGKPTRPEIRTGFPIKGTAAIDPRGFPILYAGMGINKNGMTYGEFRYRIFSLIDQSLLYAIPGKDPQAFIRWGAFDSSGLINRQTDTFIECAENGLVYKVKLNTKFDKESGEISIDPDLVKYRYKGNYKYSSRLGIENSPVFYRNYIYFADNGGMIQCTDINTLEPVWTAYAEDDTDSTPVISEEDGSVFLYTANEVDVRCKGTGLKSANCQIRKFNALDGTIVWKKDYACMYDSVINGGALATPVVGKNDIGGLIIFNIAKRDTLSDGELLALDKKTGSEVWARKLDHYCWSSPVDFLGNDGKTYLIFCDSNGDMHLVDPVNGKDLDKISLGMNVEGSPAIYNDTIVVGSYALKIFGIKIK